MDSPSRTTKSEDDEDTLEAGVQPENWDEKIREHRDTIRKEENEKHKKLENENK